MSCAFPSNILMDTAFFSQVNSLTANWEMGIGIMKTIYNWNVTKSFGEAETNTQDPYQENVHPLHSIFFCCFVLFSNEVPT